MNRAIEQAMDAFNSASNMLSDIPKLDTNKLTLGEAYFIYGQYLSVQKKLNETIKHLITLDKLKGSFGDS